jgi:hypothetical protein
MTALKKSGDGRPMAGSCTRGRPARCRRQGHLQSAPARVLTVPAFRDAALQRRRKAGRSRRPALRRSQALLIATCQNLKRLLCRRGCGRRPFPSGAAGVRLGARPVCYGRERLTTGSSRVPARRAATMAGRPTAGTTFFNGLVRFRPRMHRGNGAGRRRTSSMDDAAPHPGRGRPEHRRPQEETSPLPYGRGTIEGRVAESGVCIERGLCGI